MSSSQTDQPTLVSIAPRFPVGDMEQALRTHEQAGRTGTIKVFAEEVSWMRLRTQELRLALR